MYNNNESSKFAIRGGKPAFREKLHVNKPNTPNKQEFEKLMCGVFSSGIFSNDGPLVRELEDKICDYLDVECCIATTNGTLAMAILLVAMGIKGEVIIPSFTFISTPHLLKLFGIKPVFCDVEKDTQNLDVKHCGRLINDNTAAIISTHLWGRACEIKKLELLSRKNKIKLIFDASHAFGCRTESHYIGNSGDAEFFSFHATKFFHTFEGGCVTTNDPNLASKLREVRNFGFVEYDKVSGLGLNAKMTEICASAGLVNYDSLPETFSKTLSNYQYYKKELSGIPGVSLIDYDPNKHNCHYIVLLIDRTAFGLHRNEIIRVLHKENVIARRYFYPGCHKMLPYKNENVKDTFPNTERLAEETLLLPGGSSISKDAILKICGVIKSMQKCSFELRKLAILDEKHRNT